ncbi:MAG: transposase [Sphingomonadaceae bacterium]
MIGTNASSLGRRTACAVGGNRGSEYDSILRTVSILHTDGWKAYRGIETLGYRHKFVNHQKGIWLDSEGTSTLFIDGYWARLKQFLSRTHVRINEAHIEKYVKEFELRFNYRNDPAGLFYKIISCHPGYPMPAASS